MSDDFTPKSHNGNFVKLQRQDSFHMKKIEFEEKNLGLIKFVPKKLGYFLEMRTAIYKDQILLYSKSNKIK